MVRFTFLHACLVVAVSVILLGLEAERKSAWSQSAESQAALLRKEGEELFYRDPKAALERYLKASELEPNHPDGLIRLGYLQGRTGNDVAALAQFENVLSLPPGKLTEWQIGEATRGVGNVHSHRKEYDKAETWYMKARAIAERIDDKDQLAATSSNLGLIERWRNRPDQAGARFREAIDLKPLVRRQEIVGRAYQGLARLNLNAKEFDDAISSHKSAITLFEQVVDKDELIRIYGVLGGIYLERSKIETTQTEMAEQYFNKALELLMDTRKRQVKSAERFIAITYRGLSEIYEMRGQWEAAETALEKALAHDVSGISKGGLALSYERAAKLKMARGEVALACDSWSKALKAWAEIGIKDEGHDRKVLKQFAKCPRP